MIWYIFYQLYFYLTYLSNIIHIIVTLKSISLNATFKILKWNSPVFLILLAWNSLSIHMIYLFRYNTCLELSSLCQYATCPDHTSILLMCMRLCVHDQSCRVHHFLLMHLGLFGSWSVKLHGPGNWSHASILLGAYGQDCCLATELHERLHPNNPLIFFWNYVVHANFALGTILIFDQVSNLILHSI